MKHVLVIDGGGLKGIIPALILQRLEEVAGWECYDLFDLVVGTSTGAVIGGVLSCGVSAHVLAELYCTKVPKLFTPRPWFNPANWVKDKYDREAFKDEIRKHIGSLLLGRTKTAFMTTAYNICSGRTHFIKDDNIHDNMYPMVEVISWSALSAALYFGKVAVGDFQYTHYIPDGTKMARTGAVFQDGGQGTQNCPVTVAMIEALIRWPNEKINMLSLGCGDIDTGIGYDDARKDSRIEQVINYFSQARNESAVMQQLAAIAFDALWDNFSYKRINACLPKKLDKLDGVKYVNDYIQIGTQLQRQADKVVDFVIG
jgi:uncharacterized protein